MRLNLGQSSARWQLRLPQPAADALFPEQEAALSTADAVEADVVASDQDGAHAGVLAQGTHQQVLGGPTASFWETPHLHIGFISTELGWYLVKLLGLH